VADSRPNVLWYCSDQQRFDTIGALRNPHVHTPNFHHLVARGVAFEHADCEAPICTPSRESFQTGKYPWTVHASTNGNEAYHVEPPVTRRLVGVFNRKRRAEFKWAAVTRVDRDYFEISLIGPRYKGRGQLRDGRVTFAWPETRRDRDKACR
jgi:hypothetical protein